jgi:hypothetical protein
VAARANRARTLAMNRADDVPKARSKAAACAIVVPSARK